MQGLNRYIPPDYDPKKNSTLNSHQGKKHALGKRAKDIDKGVLVVRFELPFNIWCGSCGSHIGAGVRYNAQKKKVGNYYSTPIFAFRCKCHLCSGWFEVQTDPQNAAYVVTEGAKKQDSDWDPEENGGFAARDTDAPSAAEPPADPFAHIEKTIDQATWAKKNTSRITELTEHSARLSSDPYAVSVALRRKFREEKRIMLDKQGRDDDLRDRYGLSENMDLGEEGGDAEAELGRGMWEAGRERLGLAIPEAEPDGEGESSGSVSVRAVAGTPSISMGSRKGKGRAGHPGATGTGTPDLASALRKSTARKYDPFGGITDALFSASPVGRIRPVARGKDPNANGNGKKETNGLVPLPTPTPIPAAPAAPPLLAGLAGYDSD